MLKKRIRVLLSKGGLDGHDRGILIVAQALRDAGVEVVYGGLYQSPEEIVGMAIEEDVDMVGISIHSHAHLAIFSEVLRLLKDKTSKNDWFLFGGGVIPQKDIPILYEMGVKKIFLAGTTTEEIAKFVLEAKIVAKKGSISDLIERAKNGEVLAASHLMTLIQKDRKKAQKMILALPPLKEDTLLIGITGPGGVGKSALINKLISAFLKENKTIGVIANDPVSLSGGAFLGDRIRMQGHTLDPRVFIRSLAQYENFKGVTPEAPYIIKVFGAMQKEVIILETVGAGQSDIGFRDLVGILVWVTTPDLGDEIQILKGGAIETADIIVVNKADKSQGELLFQDLLRYFGNSKKIYKTNSLTGEGISELVEGIKRR